MVSIQLSLLAWRSHMNMNPAVSICIKLHITAIPTSVPFPKLQPFSHSSVSESTSSEPFFSLKNSRIPNHPTRFQICQPSTQKKKHATSPRVLPSDEARLAAFLAVVFDHLIRAFQGFIDLRLQGDKRTWRKIKVVYHISGNIYI